MHWSSSDNRVFADRHAAGQFLASKLKQYAHDTDAVVLGLPRGGVPVAYEIARELGLPLDVFIVRKLGAPVYEELAMGAIATGGVRVLNEDVIRRLGITGEMIDAATEEQEEELLRRERQYRGDRHPLDLRDKTAILVDDGLATGASMRAAVQALRQLSPRKIVIAVPVGAPEACEQFESEVDEVVCGKTPRDFSAVGRWYGDFRQTTDDEVVDLLDNIAHRQKLHAVAERHPGQITYFV